MQCRDRQSRGDLLTTMSFQLHRFVGAILCQRTCGHIQWQVHRWNWQHLWRLRHQMAWKPASKYRGVAGRVRHKNAR